MKKLFFILFTLYWVFVYGIAFFHKGLKNKVKYSSLGYVIPYGYNMFVPITKTTFNVTYKYFYSGDLVEEITSDEYLRQEKVKKGFVNHKIAFNKQMLYFYRISDLDVAFKRNVYNQKYKNIHQDFYKSILKDKLAIRAVHSLNAFAVLYQKEKQFLADSVLINVYRKPMIVPFAPNYKNDMSYIVGDTVFYKKWYPLKNKFK